MKTDPNLKSLLSLMDDPDSMIRDAVQKRLLDMGEDAFTEMENLLPEFAGRIDPGYYISYINNLRREIVFTKLSDFCASPDPLLIEGLLLVSQALDPSMDKQFYKDLVQEMSDEMLLELSDNRTAIENLEIFNYIFFRRFGFKHVDESVTHPENAIITNVISSKRGNIFTIPLCYFLLARYAGLPVYPLIVAKSFTPAYIDNDDNILFYINIYKEGVIFSDDQLKKNLPLQDGSDPFKLARIGTDKALVSIYAEHLSYLFGAVKDDENQKTMQRVLECFGEERYIN